MLSGRDHVFDYANEAYNSIIGNRDINGKTVTEAVNEVVRQGFIEILDGVYRTGDPFVAKDLEVELNRGPDGEKQKRMLDIVYQPLIDPDYSISGILVQALDVTELRAEERHREILSEELGHRLKDQLAMVQAIASQTLRNAPDLRTARKDLAERIAVLSRTHDAVIEGGSGSSKVGDIVAQMTAVYSSETERQITTAGPNLRIGSRPALSLSLILHESATNAVKYGALSTPDGHVSLTWGVAGPQRDRFQLEWKESGGPRVPDRPIEGTGTRLIKAGLNGTADCRVEINHAPDGVELAISAELAGFQQEH